MEGLSGKLQKVLSRFPEVKLCILFGSMASGKSSRSSDVDIAVAAEEALAVDRRLDLLEALSQATGREVDLVDLTTAWGPILPQVLSRGVVVQNLDRQLYARLISRMLFNQADMMPYYERTLRERRERFLNE
jgi:uncharacterized protein